MPSQLAGCGKEEQKNKQKKIVMVKLKNENLLQIEGGGFWKCAFTVAGGMIGGAGTGFTIGTGFFPGVGSAFGAAVGLYLGGVAAGLSSSACMD